MEESINYKLLGDFIEKFHREVSFINAGFEEQIAIDDTFQSAYKCLSDFIQMNNQGLDLIITPLSTSLLGSCSKGIMIPDVPIGIIVTSQDDKNREKRQQILLQNILCYIGIVNSLEDVSLSGIIKTLTNSNLNRLYGIIRCEGEMTYLMGLDGETQQPFNWKDEDNTKAFDEIDALYNNSHKLLPYHKKKRGNLSFTITPQHYNNIKESIKADCDLIKIGKDKKRLALLSHRILCKKTNFYSSYYFFNPPFIKDDEGAYLNYGNIVITVNEKIDAVWEKILCFFSLQLLSSYRVHFQKKIESDLLLSNQKTAKVAIMSRNMSHNLGSHVMFYIKQRLESVGSIFNEGTLEDLIRYRTIDELKEKVDELKKQWNDQHYETEMPFLVGLGRFINYLQERQDFIATVATNYIPYSTIINFKDAIYDELKPDLRAERHRGDESMKGRYPDNLLLQYIAKSEGFESSAEIELLFHKFDGTGTPQNVPENLRTFNIALPGGNLGRQAFFSIMENIIRNTAKHDKNKAIGGRLKFQFKRLEEAYTIDNILGHSLRRGERKNEKCDNTCYVLNQNKYFYLGITVLLDGKVSDTTIEKIRKGLQQEYITEDGQMDENCKGLKEIRISAAWMRGEELDNEISKEEPPAVAIRDDGGHLQYVICLPKPKRVAFLTGTNGKLDEEGCREFVLPSKDDKRRQKEIADFEMVVCSEEQRKELVFVGSRILVVGDVNNYVRKYKENGLGEIYKEWLQQEYTNHINNVKLSILDGKVSESIKVELPTDIEILRGTADDTLPSKYNNNIVFNTHYPGQALSKNKELFAQAHFVESVSGANSTDRLIRHDNRDMAWYCNQMSAGLTDVAIFDERLYKHIVPQEGLGLDHIKKTTEDYLRDNPSATKDDFVFDMASELGLSDDDMCLIGDGLSEDLSLDNCVEYLKPFIRRDYSKTWQFREKKIWAFDIQINNDGGIEIIGYNAPPTDGAIGLYNPYKYFETTIGYIKDDNNHFFVDLEPSNDIFLKRFDFISIHQGLLDKVYGQLDIHDDYQKEEVTKAIFDCFSKSSGKAILIDQEGSIQKTEMEVAKCKYFLPKFIIHSGRSKPNHKDMPQHLPFLQFSAIDHAVRDCKSTLTELFYSAHYE